MHTPITVTAAAMREIAAEPDDIAVKLSAAVNALQAAVDAAIKDRDYRLATLLGPALSVVRRRLEERAEEAAAEPR